MVINTEKLLGELVARGIPATGCSSDGRITFTDSATASDRAKAAAVLAAHSSTPTRDQALRALGRDPVVWALVALASSVATPAQRAWAQGVIDAEATRAQGVL